MLFAFLPSMGPMEMAIVGVVAVLLFGKRLPSVMRSLGSSLVEFKKGLHGVQDDLKEAGEGLTDASRAANDAVDLKKR